MSGARLQQDGTLIGTALVTCFGYWIIVSAGIYTMAYVFNTDVPMIQVFSMLGYALFGHCIVTLLTSVFHPVHSHLFFYGLLALLALPSSIRLGVYLAYKTKDRTHKLILGGIAVGLHLSFLLYLHFGFHVTVEEIEAVMGPEGTTKLEGLMGEAREFGALQITVPASFVPET